MKARLTIMNKEMLEAMKNRRSIRSYRKDLMIQEDVLQEILKTATYAPTGGGRQSPVIIAIKDKEMRDHISKLNAQIMGDKDADPFYGAPVIALVLADGSRSTCRRWDQCALLSDACSKSLWCFQCLGTQRKRNF